ncbi:DsbA family protein [Baekduia sp.]|jgi:protein-disulfide isomerase|uniref:DsbA family protein n=1 Tax=Baekduia sp. TaxID=2600305 RepID=UPI002DFEF61D|nr:thioredoxin domain-containing protein [Baekduia sp.]
MSRRLTLFSVLVGAAAAIVLAAVLVSSNGSNPTAPRAPSVRDVTSILRGIPQNRLTLGNPKAPVLLVEFADLQCPYCRQFAAESWPDIVARYIRTGKVKMELRLTAILGEDSAKANKAVMAAGLQNRMWDASMRFYDVQGQENSGYVTDRFLRGVLGGVHGLDLSRAMKARTSAAVRDELGAVYSLQRRYAVSSTPTLMIGTDDTDLTPVAPGVVSAEDLAKAINATLLKTV